MFKSNTANEIVYIFTWLFGIVLFYGVVHTFILEPRTNTAPKAHHVEVKHDKKVKHDDQSKHEKQVSMVKNIQVQSLKAKEALSQIMNETKALPKVTTLKPKPIQVETLVIEKVTIPVVKMVQTEKVKVTESTPVMPLDIKVPSPIKIDTTSEVKVPSIPTVPTVPTVKDVVSQTIEVSSVPSVSSLVIEVEKPTKKVMVENINVETVKNEPINMESIIEENVIKVKEVYDRDANMELLKTARQHVIEKAEATREAAMKSLNR